MGPEVHLNTRNRSVLSAETVLNFDKPQESMNLKNTAPSSNIMLPNFILGNINRKYLT